MAQSNTDSEDYNCEHRDHKDGQFNSNCPVNHGTPCSYKLSTTPSSTSSSSSQSSLAFSDAFGLPPALDGGWGWFVVLGAFMISLICDGCAFSFGVIFVYLVDEFHQTKSETAWVASIFYCLSMLLGPVASALTSRYGCRSITIIAGITSCVGFVSSAYVTSVWQLYITFGIIVGSSFSICYVSSVLTVAYYFDKRRSLATGLSVCGTGIGTFTFAPLIEFLSDMYGWRGAMILLGAISLNICVCGALFRPLTFTPEQRHKNHLNAFNRLARPVSRLSIPSRNRSRLHSTNSDTSDSCTSESEDDPLVLACYSQITLPTYVDADKDLIKMYLEKLPELRRSAFDPQLALQRFFKSKDTAKVSSKTHSPAICEKDSKQQKPSMTSVEYIKEFTFDNGDVADVEFDLNTENTGKKKKRKLNSKRNAERNAALSEKSVQDLTGKLLESTSSKLIKKTALSDQELKVKSQHIDSTLLSDKSMLVLTEKLTESVAAGKSQQSHHHQHRHKEKGVSIDKEENMPERPLERSQSEKTPSKLQCKTDSRVCLERAASEKLPAKLKCQPEDANRMDDLPQGSKSQQQRKIGKSGLGKTETFISQQDHPHNNNNNNERTCRVTKVTIENSCSDLGMMLMKKHSTYLILHRNDIFFRGSRVAKAACATSCPELSRLPSSDSESEDECCLLKCGPCMEPVVESMEDACDRKVISHPLFILLAISNFLLYFWADVPYVFVTDFALSRGISDSQATFLISVVGIVNTVGQVIYGLIGDQDWNLTVIYGISCIGSGLAVLLLPAATSYWLMSTLCGLFGFFVSANYSLMTVMLVGYLGLEKLAQAYGLIMMIQGLANLGGPPLAGWLVDINNSYEIAFPVAGGFIMLSGVIVFLLYIIRLCGRFCHYCQSPRRRSQSLQVSCASQTETSSRADWTNGPPAGNQELV